MRLLIMIRRLIQNYFLFPEALKISTLEVFLRQYINQFYPYVSVRKTPNRT